MSRSTYNGNRRLLGAAGCAVLVVASLTPAVRGDLPAISLATLFPPGARAGTTVEVTVAGGDLDDLAELRFAHPGIFSRPAFDAAGKPVPNRFLVAIGPGVPPGVYDARAVGRFGISLPRAFAVGDLPEAAETPTNTSPGGATELPLGSTVNGFCSPTAADHFKFTAKAGQRIQVECATREIDSRLEAVLVLTDAAGRELERSRRGGLIDFTAPADGQFLVGVYDATYRGGPEFFYRLTASTRPHVDFVFPPAGQPGTRAKFVLYGRNLGGAAATGNVTVDGKSLEQLPVEIDLPATGPVVLQGVAPALPPQVAQRGFEYRLRSDRGTSNGAFILFTDAAPVVEPADNDKPDAPAKLTLPAVLAGQFYPQRDRDWFTFDAKRGEAWKLEVWSQRLGVATDPFLLVQRVTKNDKGEVQSADVQEVYDSDDSGGGADYSTASRDPGYRLEAKEDGTYRVEVRDLFNTTRDDPRLAYVLAARRETPDFSLIVAPVRASAKDAPATPLLRRGGAVPVRVVAVRRDGFGGDIHLSAEGLPAGVDCAGATIAAGGNVGTLVFTAAENAPGWAGTVRIVGKADVAGAAVVREATGAAVTFNPGESPTDAVQSRLTADFAAGVCWHDLAPVTIEPGEQKAWEGTVGGKVQVPLKLTWRGDAAGKFKLKAGGHPALNEAAESEIDAKAPAASVEIDLNRHKLPPGTHTLYVRAEGKVKYQRNEAAAKAAEDAKQAADKAAADAAAAAKQAVDKLAAAKAGTDAEATKAAEKAAADADAATKAAEQRKKDTTAQAAAAAPKDVDAVLYSHPIVVKVLPAK